MTLVLVIQRYIPAYRAPLFAALEAQFAMRGVQLLVVHGSPHGWLRAREDTAPDQGWAQSVHEITLRLPRGVEPTWKRLGSLPRLADAVVAELGSTSLNSWELVARYPEKTLLWGHGKSYIKRAGRLDSAIERLLCQRAAHVLTYTETGKAYLLAQGIATSHVTAIGNSTDTISLMRLKDETQGDAQIWRERVQSEGPVALFVGGLDVDKQIPRLIAAGRAAFGLDQSFRLILAGSGKDSHLVKASANEPWLLWLSNASPHDLAGLSHVCSAVWMPGRVGLVAVDALALGLPVLTTRFPFHAPEIEYLVEGESVHFLPEDPLAFAVAALEKMMMSPRPVGEDTREGMPTVEIVASRMATAIMGVVERS